MSLALTITAGFESIVPTESSDLTSLSMQEQEDVFVKKASGIVYWRLDPSED